MHCLMEVTNCRSCRLGISTQIALMIALRNHENRKSRILGGHRQNAKTGQYAAPAEELSLPRNGDSRSVVLASFDVRSRHQVPSSQVRGASPVAGSKGRRPGQRLHPWGRRCQ